MNLSRYNYYSDIPESSLMIKQHFLIAAFGYKLDGDILLFMHERLSKSGPNLLQPISNTR